MSKSRKLVYRFIYLFLILFIVQTDIKSVRATGTSYYVSYSAGNDNNDGLSTSTPWRTLDKVSSVTFSEGDNIYLKCGDTWSGQKLILKGTALQQIRLLWHPMAPVICPL